MNYVFHLPCLLRRKHTSRCFHVLASSDGGFQCFRLSFSCPVRRKNYGKVFNSTTRADETKETKKNCRVRLPRDLFVFVRMGFKEKFACLNVCVKKDCSK